MARARGRGMAASWYGIARTATVDRAGAWAELDDGGTAKIVTGVTEIGEGILTVLARQYGAIGTEIASIDKSIMALHRGCEASRRLAR